MSKSSCVITARWEDQAAEPRPPVGHQLQIARGTRRAPQKSSVNHQAYQIITSRTICDKGPTLVRCPLPHSLSVFCYWNPLVANRRRESSYFRLRAAISFRHAGFLHTRVGGSCKTFAIEDNYQ